MIKKILIANRGEIVNRIIDTCEKMNIDTVVVYSDGDKDADYINRATESYNIGGSAPVKSYLNINKIVEVIKKSGADAVHPGYGFLSESAEFADSVQKAGAIWIGPNYDILKSIESKCYCRIVADKVNVPVTPGTIKPIKSINEIYETAEKVGLPILLKLDKGGGGKGIKRIDKFESEDVTKAIYESMQRIGKMAFASDEIYIEKAINEPRHIEVQFCADNFGNIVCFGERECSIQRRYQKIIEESPSVVVNLEDRKKLYSWTKALISEIKYTGVGTVEFLRDKQGDFYFMEINARLQVEHPVSELVTGIDLVECQINIANGEKIGFNQDDIEIKGHAIECRIYAEDPKTFKPALGMINNLEFPDMSKGNVRVEHALKQGFKVSPFYDPMICKLAVWGENREKCISNMINALKEFVIDGVTNTITTDLAIMRNKSFVEGNFTTAFLDMEKVNIGLENYVITISRQFGSLGRPIAKKMAQLLNIEYYDRDIVDKLAQETNLPVSTVSMDNELNDSEYIRMKYPLGKNDEDEQNKIFQAQSKIITKLAEKGSCIIVGRCSDYILRNQTNHFSIYIYSSYEERINNCINSLNMSKAEAEEMINSVDEARKSYKLHYAKTYSEGIENKDMLIDSSSYKNIDETAKVLVDMIKVKFNLS